MAWQDQESEVWIVERPAMSKSNVTKEAVRRSAVRSTKASARLERRVVPTGFVRSARVAQFLAERRHEA